MSDPPLILVVDDEQAIRVVTRDDIGLLHPEAVVVLTESGS